MNEILIFCFLLQTFKEPIYKDVVLNFLKPCAWWTHSSHLWRHLGSASKIPHCHQDACCFGEKRIKDADIGELIMFNQWFCAVVYFFFSFETDLRVGYWVVFDNIRSLWSVAPRYNCGFKSWLCGCLGLWASVIPAGFVIMVTACCLWALVLNISHHQLRRGIWPKNELCCQVLPWPVL